MVVFLIIYKKCKLCLSLTIKLEYKIKIALVNLFE